MAKKEVLKQKSPAEFFADNKNIAGFDNPGKCLYTTVRELVENSLDSAESLSVLPEISITIKELSQNELNKVRGIENHERLDEELFKDFENDAERQKRIAKEAKELDKLEKAIGKNTDGSQLEQMKKQIDAKKAALATGKIKTFYKVSVKDNGTGMPHDDIPKLLGKVLSGTKYGVQQTRGKFGLGAKMALIWSKMSTGLPIEIWSALKGQDYKSHFILDIDILKNEPNVHLEEKLGNEGGWHGAELSVTILGNWQYYRAKVAAYLRQIAVITPYAHFSFSFQAQDTKHSLSFVCSRRTNKIPAPPQETKHHPSSVDLELVKRLTASTTAKTLKSFLCKEFSSITPGYAARLITESRCGAEPGDKPSLLTAKQITQLHQLFHEAKFEPPGGEHLSPAGVYNLRLGITKELRPELVATHEGDVRVSEGHAFMVEAGVSIGGQSMKPGLNIHRFANRIPLLFEAGSDVITKTAKERINWSAYKINHNQDRVGVFVSIVSTKIPYKGAGKEYIADEVKELQAAVKHSIQQCCSQLRVSLVKKQAEKEQQLRLKSLTALIPNAAEAVMKILHDMAARRPGSKRKHLEDAEEENILDKVKSGEITVAVCRRKLEEFAKKMDAVQALDYQRQQGMVGVSSDPMHLMPRGPGHHYGPRYKASACIFQFLSFAPQAD